MTTKAKLDSLVENNFRKVSLKLIVAPLVLLFLFFSFFILYNEDSFTDTYIASQKDLFLKLNSILSVNPNLEYNISYLGDALIIFPFVFIFLFIAPKLWEAIIKSSILTLITSAILKFIFTVPRPAALFDTHSFTIMGRPNILHTSLPSGHSMTILMVVTILLYGLMPKKLTAKIFWSTSLVILGLIVAFSRVAIGAHYPFDVVIGCVLGYIMAIIGIRIYRDKDWLYWIKDRRFYPIIMVLLLVWTYMVTLKLIKHNMVIFYLSLLALIVSLAVIINMYVKGSKA